jgi:hypothetical protein
LTLQEQDRPGQRCKLLKAWRTPDGSRAYLVQVVQTAELLTVVESAPADPKGKSAAMKIYHWGSSPLCPADAPMAPANAVVLGQREAAPKRDAAPKAEVAVKPTEPTPPKAEVAVKPTTPATPKAEVAVKPTEPTLTKAEVAVKPTEPTPTKAEVAVKPTEPTPTKTDVAVKPTTPTTPKAEVAVKPTEPTPTKADVVVKPTAAPKVGVAVKPTTAPKADVAVKPTAPTASKTDVAVKPTQATQWKPTPTPAVQAEPANEHPFLATLFGWRKTETPKQVVSKAPEKLAATKPVEKPTVKSPLEKVETVRLSTTTRMPLDYKGFVVNPIPAAHKAPLLPTEVEKPLLAKAASTSEEKTTQFATKIVIPAPKKMPEDWHASEPMVIVKQTPKEAAGPGLPQRLPDLPASPTLVQPLPPLPPLVGPVQVAHKTETLPSAPAPSAPPPAPEKLPDLPTIQPPAPAAVPQPVKPHHYQKTMSAPIAAAPAVVAVTPRAFLKSPPSATQAPPAIVKATALPLLPPPAPPSPVAVAAPSAIGREPPVTSVLAGTSPPETPTPAVKPVHLPVVEKVESEPTPPSSLPHAHPGSADPLMDPNHFARKAHLENAAHPAPDRVEPPAPELVKSSASLPPLPPLPGATTPAAAAPTAEATPTTPAPVTPVRIEPTPTPTAETITPTPAPTTPARIEPTPMAPLPAKSAAVKPPAPAPATPPTAAPAGMASVAAATTATVEDFIPTPSGPAPKVRVASTRQATRAPVRTQPAAPTEYDPDALQANAFTDPPPPPPPVDSGNAFPVPHAPQGVTPYPGMQMPMQAGMPMQMPMQAGMPMQMPSMEAAVAPGMANAFTAGSTPRPIPANFGANYAPPNAFRDQVGRPMGVGGMQPYPPMMGYAPPMMMAQPTPARPVLAAMPSTVASSVTPDTATTPQLMSMLRDALYPSYREMAAERLGVAENRTQPPIVNALVLGAREDPAATVRAACVRALTTMKAEGPAVEAVYRELRQDPDERVRRTLPEVVPVSAPGR